MSQTISGYQTLPQSLAAPGVLVTGTVNAYGSLPGYVSSVHGSPVPLNLDAAILGAAPRSFSLTNTGLIESQGTAGNPFDFAIVLGAAGSIVNAGIIEAASGIGMFGTGTSYIENRATIAGTLGAGIILFGGAATLANSGGITGARYAGIALFGGGLVTNSAGGSITGGQYAIAAERQPAQVINAGTLTGGEGGINLVAGGIAQNTGLIRATGTGDGYFEGGILTGHGGTIENAGTISGQNGIAEAYGNGSGTLAVTLAGTIGNSGVIDAQTSYALLGTLHAQPFLGVGIALGLPGTVVNTGVITASNAGILTQNYNGDATQITNTSAGRIASAHYGVYLQGQHGAVTNAGQITGIAAGLLALGQAELRNAGTIASTGTSFALGTNTYAASAVAFLDGGTVTNLQSGTITALQVAVGGGDHLAPLNHTTLINAGLVAVTGTQVETIAGAAFGPIAVDLRGGGTVFNQQTGRISGQQTGILAEAGSGQTAFVENEGLIQALGTVYLIGGSTVATEGVVLADPGTLENAKTGVITAQNGVAAEAGGSIGNDGVITGTEIGLLAQASAAAQVTASNAGTIQATGKLYDVSGTDYASVGVEIENAGSFTNQSGGLVTGNYGVFFGDLSTSLAGGALSNAGIIAGNYFGALLTTGGFAGNTGTISAAREALVMVSNTASLGTIENAGTIAAPDTYYVQGTIAHVTESVVLTGGGTLVNQKGGDIAGGIGAVLVGNATTLINAGTISGLYPINGVAFAAYLAGAAERVIVNPNAVFNGLVYDLAGDGALELTTGNGALTGIGAQFANFQTLEFDPGAAWSVSGGVAGFDHITSVTGFGLDDTVTLNGFVANGYAFAPGTGLELSGLSGTAAVDALLALPGTLAATDFLVTVAGGATSIVETIIGAASIVSGADERIAAGVTVSSLVLAGGTLALDPGGSIAGEIRFTGTRSLLVLEQGAAAGNVITGFAPGDSIALGGVTFNAALDSFTVASAGTLTIDADGVDHSLLIAGVTVGQDNFILGPGLTVTESATCFCPGTRIATPRGAVPVENLVVGDAVLTRDAGVRPILWIGRRAYDGRFIAGNPLVLPVCIQAGAMAPGVPARALVVSPGHGLRVGGALVPAWRLVNGVSITQAAAVDRVEYFHIELPGHELVLAEGCPAESFYDDGCRGQFGAAAAGVPGAGLARTESGFLLQAIQRRLGVAAGAAGPVRGFVDQAGPRRVSGWAWNGDAPVCLDVTWRGRRVARVLANTYRADLRAAELGSGCHGFELALPRGITGPVEVCVAATGEPLALTEAARAA